MSAILHTDTVAVTTVREALEELLRVVAARDVLKAYEDDVRGWLRTESDRLEAETGTKANFTAKGVGRAYVTDPSHRPVIVDRAAVERLAEQADVGVVRRVVDASALQHDLDKGQIPAALLEGLAPYLRDERVLPEKWLDEVAESCDVVGDRLVDRETGLVIEGVEMVVASKPTLTFRADPLSRKRTAAALAERVPAIGGGA